ncbi:glycerophosphodiester phosphodiesterase [Paenibacillus sp. FSL H8-0034]|uniref:glycerophosphodiester phosphodiesterase n=1 Tax=Paenibacillus sp. FSL H8-0034 TaxID=2954671 RepID=UPI0030F97EF2
MMKVKGIAHRGCPNRYPENTLISFKEAVKLSYSYLELDVQLSKDGVPVIIHDTSVDRMTNGQGRVKDLTLAELKELRIGGTEQISTLEEALTLLRDQLIIDIELKQMGNLYPGLEEKVLTMVQEMGMLDQVFFSSFDHYSMVKLRQLEPKAEIGLINHSASPALFPFLKELNARYLSISLNYVTPELIQRCEQENIIFIPYPVDREEDMRDMLRYPSVLICTNELERWASISSAG